MTNGIFLLLIFLEVTANVQLIDVLLIKSVILILVYKMNYEIDQTIEVAMIENVNEIGIIHHQPNEKLKQNRYSVVYPDHQAVMMMLNQNSIHVLYENYRPKRKLSKLRAVIQHPEHVIVECLAHCLVHYRNFVRKNHGLNKKNRKKRKLRRNWKINKIKSVKL